MFSPEFAEHWLPEHEVATSGSEAAVRDAESSAQAQQEALEALADRVNAARSVY